MNQKSFSLKNLTNYYNLEENKKSHHKFVFPKIINFVPNRNLQRKESKIELNRKISFFINKTYGKLPGMPENNQKFLLDDLPKAPRLNFNSNFEDRVLLKKEIPKIPVYKGNSVVFKVDNGKRLRKFSNLKETITAQHQKRRIIARPTKNKSRGVNNSMSLLYDKQNNTSLQGNIDESCLIKNHIDDYFENIIKEFGLEDVSPRNQDEVNIFDLYLDSELNTLNDL